MRPSAQRRPTESYVRDRPGDKSGASDGVRVTLNSKFKSTKRRCNDFRIPNTNSSTNRIFNIFKNFEIFENFRLFGIIIYAAARQ